MSEASVNAVYDGDASRMRARHRDEYTLHSRNYLSVSVFAMVFIVVFEWRHSPALRRCLCRCLCRNFFGFQQRPRSLSLAFLLGRGVKKNEDDLWWITSNPRPRAHCTARDVTQSHSTGL